MLIRLIHVFPWLIAHFFSVNSKNILLSRCTIVYIFTCWGTSWLLPCFSSCKPPNRFLYGHKAQLLWVNTRQHNCGSRWLWVSSFCQKLPKCLPEWLYRWHPTVSKWGFLLLHIHPSSAQTLSVSWPVLLVWHLITSHHQAVSHLEFVLWCPLWVFIVTLYI